MRHSTITLALCLAISMPACQPFGAGPSLGRSRAECHSRNGTSREHDFPPEDDFIKVSFDTAILFTAVRFPESYDWRRDTSYGSVEYEIVLFRNYEESLRIGSTASCISPAHDTHHIIDGHLYTECSDRTHTIIGMDGQELFRFNGREFLKGLLPEGNDIYTLTQKRSGEGFSLRKNGEVIFSKNSGTIYGDMYDPSYGETGALYRDGGACCFTYSSGSPGTTGYYMVRDGTETEMDISATGQVQDIKIVNGKPYVAASRISGYTVRDGRIWSETAGCSISGTFSYGSDLFSGVMPYGNTGSIRRICSQEASIFHRRTEDYAVFTDKSGIVHIAGVNGDMDTSFPGYWFISPSCASLAPRTFCTALEPEDPGGHPILVISGKSREIPVHGYISRVSVSISPAR